MYLIYYVVAILNISRKEVCYHVFNFKIWNLDQEVAFGLNNNRYNVITA